MYIFLNGVFHSGVFAWLGYFFKLKFGLSDQGIVQPFLPELDQIIKKIEGTLAFVLNNCLINFYPNGKSSMGFHSDQTDILEAGTGIAIVSLGETRSLRFRNIAEPSKTDNYELPAGSLIYMTQDVQSLWQHSIPKADTQSGRMSLTFRRIK